MPVQAVVRVWPPDTTILWPLVQISWLIAQWSVAPKDRGRGASYRHHGGNNTIFTEVSPQAEAAGVNPLSADITGT